MLSGFRKLFKPMASEKPESANLAEKLAQARAALKLGLYDKSGGLCEEIVKSQPDCFEAHIVLAESATGKGDRTGAILNYTAAIELRPADAHAYYKRGNLLKDLGHLDMALASYDQAVACDTGSAAVFCNRGAVLERLGKLDDACASYERAIALDSKDALAYYNRAGVMRQLGRLHDALADYDRAISILPGYAAAHCNRGVLLQALQRSHEALASYDKAMVLDPGLSQAYFGRGVLLQDQKRWDAARADYDQAIILDPAYAEAFCNRGVLLMELRQWDAAFDNFAKAISVKPDFPQAYWNRGVLFSKLSKNDAALADFDKAIELKPDYAEAFYSRAEILRYANRTAAAVESYDLAFVIDPHLRFLLGARRHAKMSLCDWGGLQEDLDSLLTGLESRQPVSPPLPILALLNSASMHLRVSQIWAQEEHPVDVSLPNIAARAPRRTIRIGYFSPDFREHALASLMVGVFENHDRTKFELIAFSLGVDTQDAMKKRLEKAFDRFIEVRDKSDREIALLSRELAIDIAVDLGGYTANARPGIFALRAAPIQINYLGYPGTLGGKHMDYVIADNTLIPEEDQVHFSEKVLYLPCFQANDSKRQIADRLFTRAELGLPVKAFVFCCFNGNYKILPETFDRWMRILGRVPDSVLWLFAGNDLVMENLRREACARGIDKSRLVFAATLPLADHLARYRAADLFLDTLPYSAGTTASDALWAGLPVLTLAGTTFAGRMAASLLDAAGMPELITRTGAQYEELAVALGTDSLRFTQLRARLEQQRSTSLLFDTAIFTGHLESAFIQADARFQAGMPPDNVYVQ